jgi:predicted nucleic acid-binding protein
VIYLDTSVVLAQLLGEDRAPSPALWRAPLVASRLLECELWVRIHARKLAESHGDAVRRILAGVSFVELGAPVLLRATQAFPVPLRTLDALHVASIEVLRARGQDVRLATLDERMATAARALGIARVEV